MNKLEEIPYFDYVALVFVAIVGIFLFSCR